MKQVRVGGWWLAALLIASGTALAATTTSSFTVNVLVSATCAISANPMNFPPYTGVVDTATTTLSITCTNTTPYSVGLNAGLAPGATVASRKMQAGGASMAYALFSNPARTLNWGETVGTDTVGGTGTGVAQSLTVYGQISAGQFVNPGNYVDTITATVTY